MPAAAEYDRLLRWRPRVITRSSSRAPSNTWPAIAATWWAAVEEVTGGSERVLDAEQARNRATIRVNGAVGVNPADRLVDAGYGDTWTVETVRRGDRGAETVCEAYQEADS